MSLRRFARCLGHVRRLPSRRERQFSSVREGPSAGAARPRRQWMRMVVLGIVVGTAGVAITGDNQRSAMAVLSLGRVLTEVMREKQGANDVSDCVSMEERIAAILATMAQEQTFRQALVAHGGLRVLLQALPHATDSILQQRIIEAIASVAATTGAEVALGDLEATSHLVQLLPKAQLSLFDRLKVDMALQNVHEHRDALMLPSDAPATIVRLAATVTARDATPDERKFAVQSLETVLHLCESQGGDTILDAALTAALANAALLATLRELVRIPQSPLQGPAAELLVSLYRLSRLQRIALHQPASWLDEFAAWAAVESPAVHEAAARAWHLVAKTDPAVLLASKPAQAALLQLARATFRAPAATPAVQMHICAVVSALGDGFRDGLETTVDSPMSRVFSHLDLPIADADELDATPLFGWVDVLTQWSFHGTSAVRANAIQSLTHLALRSDTSRRVLQAWLLGLLRELFAAQGTDATERRAVQEVEVLANMTAETAPGHVRVAYSDGVVEAGMAALAILAEKHAPEFIWKGGVDLLALVAISSPPAVKAQCARVLANLAAYPWTPQDPERDVQRIFVKETTGGSLFFDEIAHWQEEPNVNIRSNYFRAATNLAALQTSPEGGAAVYHEGIHPIVAQSTAAAPTMPPVDVVFVHGLRGHPFGTWRSDMASTDMVNSPIWPEALLAPDLSASSRLVTLGYEAGMVTWSSPWPSLTLPERAQIMLSSLQAARIGCPNGPPVVFVTHSMGGLLVKEMLVLARAQATDDFNLAAQTAGVVFMAVPHFGANLSSNVNARAIRTLIQAHPATKDLSAQAPHLLALHKAYEALGIPSLSLGEGQPAPLGLGVRSMVVLPESANPGGPLDEFHLLATTDHMDICKPETKDDPRYALVHAFLVRCLGGGDNRG
ncbi:hypothetical protein ACHHYP_08237 [Achlya hypogyna]|uniref:Protein SERAC1 n=1 Tax=Achlya hypogyna TaxID=1202772 RepID=A0A1V9ZL16_ACHHY|nr:hypothetical protein ACHHYP_08237 [Achlya hypogyna]